MLRNTGVTNAQLRRNNTLAKKTSKENLSALLPKLKTNQLNQTI